LRRALISGITEQDGAYHAMSIKYVIREMRIKDVSSLHHMYNMLSEDSKRFFTLVSLDRKMSVCAGF
jgi:GDP-D-mannose dehydratase